MARSLEEIQAEAEKNRRQMLAAEAAALVLLLRRRDGAVDGAGSLAARALRLEQAMRAGIVETRSAARQAATRRIRNELLTLGIRSEVAARNAAAVAVDVARATRIAANYARDWLVKASRSEAMAASVAMRSRTVTIAATETASSYNDGRASYLQRLPRQRVELLKAWDAVLDRRTCPVCSSADGAIVGFRENFPSGEPGSVHPLCRCTETILRADEVSDEILIQPARIQLVPAA